MSIDAIKVAQAQDILGPNYIISTRDEMKAIYDSQQGLIDGLTEGMLAIQNTRQELDKVLGIVSSFVPNALDMPIERAMILALGVVKVQGLKMAQVAMEQRDVLADASFEAGFEHGTDEGFERGQKAANDAAYVSGYGAGRRAMTRGYGIAGLALVALSLFACLPW